MRAETRQAMQHLGESVNDFAGDDRERDRYQNRTPNVQYRTGNERNDADTNWRNEFSTHALGCRGVGGRLSANGVTR
jgi:hypothetical protein